METTTSAAAPTPRTQSTTTPAPQTPSATVPSPQAPSATASTSRGQFAATPSLQASSAATPTPPLNQSNASDIKSVSVANHTLGPATSHAAKPSTVGKLQRIKHMMNQAHASAQHHRRAIILGAGVIGLASLGIMVASAIQLYKTEVQRRKNAPQIQTKGYQSDSCFVLTSRETLNASSNTGDPSAPVNFIRLANSTGGGVVGSCTTNLADARIKLTNMSDPTASTQAFARTASSMERALRLRGTRARSVSDRANIGPSKARAGLADANSTTSATINTGLQIVGLDGQDFEPMRLSNGALFSLPYNPSQYLQALPPGTKSKVYTANTFSMPPEDQIPHDFMYGAPLDPSIFVDTPTGSSMLPLHGTIPPSSPTITSLVGEDCGMQTSNGSSKHLIAHAVPCDANEIKQWSADDIATRSVVNQTTVCVRFRDYVTGEYLSAFTQQSKSNPLQWIPAATSNSDEARFGVRFEIPDPRIGLRTTVVLCTPSNAQAPIDLWSDDVTLYPGWTPLVKNPEQPVMTLDASKTKFIWPNTLQTSPSSPISSVIVARSTLNDCITSNDESVKTFPVIPGHFDADYIIIEAISLSPGVSAGNHARSTESPYEVVPTPDTVGIVKKEHPMAIIGLVVTAILSILCFVVALWTYWAPSGEPPTSKQQH